MGWSSPAPLMLPGVIMLKELITDFRDGWRRSGWLGRAYLASMLVCAALCLVVIIVSVASPWL
jgi:hypothetical protein